MHVAYGLLNRLVVYFCIALIPQLRHLAVELRVVKQCLALLLVSRCCGASLEKISSHSQSARVIICREIVPGPKKDRWHPLYTTSGAEELAAHELLSIFRARQNHEQGHRVEVHDLLVDAVPCGYDKESPDRKRPRFHRGPLQMIGWLVALVYNAVADLAAALGPDHVGDHVRTLRRKFFNRPGQLYETPEALIVYLDPFMGQDKLLPVIDDLNAGNHRLPWLDNRRLVMSLTPQGEARAGP